jgi:hypothetical protein
MPEANLRDGGQGAFGFRRDAEVVRTDPQGGLATATAHDEARGMQVDGILTVLIRGPIDDEFQVASHRKRTAAAQTDSARTHVLNGTDTPTGRGSLEGQSKMDRQIQFKTPFGTAFDVRQFFHFQPPWTPSTSWWRGVSKMGPIACSIIQQSARHPITLVFWRGAGGTAEYFLPADELLQIPGLEQAEGDAGVSSRTSWTHFWLWGLSSSWDPRIFPGKCAPSERYRSKFGKCNRGRSGKLYVRAPVLGLQRPEPGDASPEQAVRCWTADPGWFAECQVAWVTLNSTI